MHDTIAHSLAVVIAQADGGRYAAVASPEAGRAALATIGDCARQALGDIRRVLGVLRDGPGVPADLAPPQPGLADVPALVERVRAGGLEVRLAVRPPPGPVEPGLSLVAYRIVQEGLTNVVEHAGPAARAEVSVRWSGDRLRIDVVDDGGAGRHQPGRAGTGWSGCASAGATAFAIRPAMLAGRVRAGRNGPEFTLSLQPCPGLTWMWIIVRLPCVHPDRTPGSWLGRGSWPDVRLVRIITH
ncbi:sensor histidine kinase [Actinokineospora spheciospongiae]|uniref:sensor histidine kinase n=1 Tax=Actinokineospora spheciospongiae TaxID=909613 RepID=UPI000D716324|nr:histidine kinase [Actinokineospora spheciospongiae]PWW60273.1 histidine kinase [Actinokineospora spheciospongiae]